MRYLIILFLSGQMFAQTNPFATASVTTFEPIARDTVHVKTLSMLSKIDEEQMSLNRNPLDINYNWKRDINRSNFYDRMGYGVRRTNWCGPDLPPDIFQTVTFNALTRTAPPR